MPAGERHLLPGGWDEIRLSLRLVSAWPAAAGAAACAAGLALAGVGGMIWAPARVVESVMPLALAFSAAQVLAPDSEPALEVLCACPRPLRRVMLERLLVLIGLHGLLGLAGSLASLALPRSESLLQVSARWLAPALALVGVGLFTTQLTRQGTFGVLLVFLLWGGMLFGGDALAARWPALRWLHLFLQPDTAAPLDYALNRLALAAAGAALIWRAVRLVGDTERMLGLGRRGG